MCFGSLSKPRYSIFSLLLHLFFNRTKTATKWQSMVLLFRWARWQAQSSTEKDWILKMHSESLDIFEYWFESHRAMNWLYFWRHIIYTMCKFWVNRLIPGELVVEVIWCRLINVAPLSFENIFRAEWFEEVVSKHRSSDWRVFHCACIC